MSGRQAASQGSSGVLDGCEPHAQICWAPKGSTAVEAQRAEASTLATAVCSCAKFHRSGGESQPDASTDVVGLCGQYRFG